VRFRNDVVTGPGGNFVELFQPASRGT
jgi:hypothetical protein